MKIQLLIDSIDMTILFLIFSGITSNTEIGKIINRKHNTVSDRFSKLIDLNLATKNGSMELTKQGRGIVELSIKKVNITVLTRQIEAMSV
jgi:helix-turn-helix protein